MQPFYRIKWVIEPFLLQTGWPIPSVKCIIVDEIKGGTNRLSAPVSVGVNTMSYQ